ncbi:ribonuclease III [Allgaiera indica]|uniref:Ribonuclease III n=1 Tax=Allgaiera indica TaxID=765699 RepID=A0AAN4UUS9_9RHOB|nr:DUF2793 domain-containing protein [Allgaiera indica]GHE05465.1 ribonuclease III [Allgaiera indica]SDX71554.1 Protein of unknown function [Allgaiera indica]
MSDLTPHLMLPYLLAAQAQKHVTVNESLDRLDALVQLAVKANGTTTPPGGPAEGDRYIVGAAATGAWSGWDGGVAQFVGGAWVRLIPHLGWCAWVETEAAMVIWTGAGWQPLATALGLVSLGADTRLAEGAQGSAVNVAAVEDLLSSLSGATATSGVTIPDRAILLGVSARTVTAITGATSYDCGISGEPSKFGGALGAAAGSTNVGVIGPQAFYAPTPVVLTANGGAFTGGAVRIALHYLRPAAPQS